MDLIKKVKPNIIFFNVLAFIGLSFVLTYEGSLELMGTSAFWVAGLNIFLEYKIKGKQVK